MSKAMSAGGDTQLDAPIRYAPRKIAERKPQLLKREAQARIDKQTRIVV